MTGIEGLGTAIGAVAERVGPSVVGIGCACQQRGQQRVLPGTRRIGLVGRFQIGAEEVRTERAARDAGRSLNRQDPLSGDAVPIGYGGLGNAETARKLRHTAGSARCS